MTDPGPIKKSDILEPIPREQLLEIISGLANPFQLRKDTLSRRKWAWFGIVSLSAVLFVTGGYQVIAPLATLVETHQTDKAETKPAPVNAPQPAQTDVQPQSGSLLVVVLLRISLLTPLAILVIFAIGQYNRERELEEHYAHREAVSRSMPAYFNLFAQTNLADDTARVAGDIIFQLPDTSKEENLFEKRTFKLLEKFATVFKKVAK